MLELYSNGKSFYIYYHITDERYIFSAIPDESSYGLYRFEKDKAIRIFALIKKIEQWSAIAKKDKDTIEKLLLSVTSPSSSFISYSGTSYHSFSQKSIDIYFVANNGYVTVKIKFPDIVSDDNEYINSGGADVILYQDEFDDFFNAFGTKAREQVIVEYEKEVKENTNISNKYN